MIAAANPMPPSEAGDRPCWGHLPENTRADIVDRNVELLVRNFYRDAAMHDTLGPGFQAAHEPVLPGHRSHTHTTNGGVELICDTIDFAFHGPHAEIGKGRGQTMAAAMERLLSGVSSSGTAPVEPMWRRVHKA